MSRPIKSDIGPFAIVPKWVATAEISSDALRLFVMLMLRADRETSECWPSRRRLAEEMGVSTKSIDRWTIELEDLGVVKRTARFTDEGDRTSNLYTLRVATPESRGVDVDVATGGDSSVAVTRTSVEPERSRSSTRAKLHDELFALFWERYPRKVAKTAARKAWDHAVRRPTATNPYLVIAGAERYARECETAESARFIAHPATWLNGDRWLDEADQDPNLGMLARIVAEERSKPPELNP